MNSHEFTLPTAKHCSHIMADVLRFPWIFALCVQATLRDTLEEYFGAKWKPETSLCGSADDFPRVPALKLVREAQQED